MTETPTTCPHCSEPLEADTKFCEACGKPVDAAAAAVTTTETGAPVALTEASPADDLGGGPISAVTRQASTAATPAPITDRRPCLQCGGEVGPDGYCEQCGSKAPTERDHFREQPASWVAGVCDRGIKHSRNEDAMAMLASETPGDRAVLVVLDGVSNTDDSHIASLAGARAALEVLRSPLPQGMGTPEGRMSAVTKVFADAVQAANKAVSDTTPEGSTAPPSATFVAAVLEGSDLWYGNVGDSRAYWLPDAGPGKQLSVDDSAAQMQIEAGMSRKEAESGPQGHAITRWLGKDAPDLAPRMGHLTVDAPGWVLVCSDGLWNYASEPDALVAQMKQSGQTEPAALALALTEFANASGGQDNITTVFARVESGQAPTGQNAPQQAATEGESDG